MNYDGLNTQSARALLQHAAACHQAGDLVASNRIYQQVLKREPYLVEAAYHLGMVKLEAGAYVTAIAQFGWAVALAPGHRDALLALARTLQITGREEQAIERYRALVKQAPEDVEAWHALGVTQQTLGQLAAAEASWRRAIELAPAQAEPRALLGNLLRSQGRDQEGQSQLEHALALDPDNPGILCLIAVGHRAAGHWPQAEVFYDRALAADPDHVGAAAGKALALAARDEKGAALALLETVIASGSIAVDLALAFAQVVPDEGTRHAIALLNRALKPGPPPGPQRRALLFALGDLCDRANIPDRAFAAYMSANAMAAGNFDGTAYERRVTARIQGFKAGDHWPRAAGGNGQTPLLLVGLPGGGCDLVAATLASHSAVRLLPAAQLAQPDDTQPAALEPADLAAAATALAPDLDDSDQRLAVLPVDVLDLGLAMLCWPQARVVHGNRDPLDAGLQCYSRDLGPDGAFAADITTLASRFAAERRLLDHWQQVLPMAFLEVAYERLLRRSRETLAELLDFCVLDWQDACLLPAEAAESPGRHRRYGRHLRRLRLALAD